jgi:hypothetical protein
MAEPTITYGTTTKFGTLTGWVPNGATITKSAERAVSLNGIGNEVASKTHNAGSTFSQEFQAASSSAPTIPPVLGKLVGDCILTRISITTSGTDFAKMTLTGHQHDAHAHADTLNQVAHGFTMSSGYGGIDFLGGTAGDNASVESSTLTIQCGHTDTTDASGDHLIGQNHTANASANTTWVGVPTTGIGEGWDEVELGSTTESNTGHVRTTFGGIKSLTLAAP